MKKARIELALEKKLACRQNAAKVNRIRKGIEVALANAEERLAAAEDSLDNLIQGFNVDTDVSCFIRKVSDALYHQDDCKSAIEQLHRVSSYLFEELEAPESEGSE